MMFFAAPKLPFPFLTPKSVKILFWLALFSASLVTVTKSEKKKAAEEADISGEKIASVKGKQTQMPMYNE